MSGFEALGFLIALVVPVLAIILPLLLVTRFSGTYAARLGVWLLPVLFGLMILAMGYVITDS